MYEGPAEGVHLEQAGGFPRNHCFQRSCVVVEERRFDCRVVLLPIASGDSAGERVAVRLRVEC